MKSVEVIGVASDLGTSNAHCSLGPSVLHQSSLSHDMDRTFGIHLNWRSTIYPSSQQPQENAKPHFLTDVCHDLGQHTETLTRSKTPFVVIGGDHSCAIGTWGGVMNGLADPSTFGLIWIDAHLDAHTFETSPSGNIHGMPVAALLGAGGDKLKEICPAKQYLSAENLLMLGIRSFEPEEKELLEKMNVRIITSDKFASKQSLPNFFKQLIKEASEKWDYFGISIDLDAMDPNDAPAVGTPVAQGLSSAALCDALKEMNNSDQLVGIEIAEYQPSFDQQSKTQHLIRDIIGAVYGIHH